MEAYRAGFQRVASHPDADTSSFDTTRITRRILTPDIANERALFDITRSYAAKRLPPVADRRPALSKSDALLRVRFFTV